MEGGSKRGAEILHIRYQIWLVDQSLVHENEAGGIKKK
jgi:hypothetical protein